MRQFVGRESFILHRIPLLGCKKGLGLLLTTVDDSLVFLRWDFTLHITTFFSSESELDIIAFGLLASVGDGWVAGGDPVSNISELLLINSHAFNHLSLYAKTKLFEFFSKFFTIHQINGCGPTAYSKKVKSTFDCCSGNSLVKGSDLRLTVAQGFD